MTLVAFALHEDRAEIVTDGLSYSAGSLEFELVRKCDVIPAWDMAVTGIGQADFGEQWRAVLAHSGAEVRDIDELHEYATGSLAKLWGQVQADWQDVNAPRGEDVEQAKVFHVGWSPARERFVAYRYTVSDAGVTHTDLTEHDLYCDPEPFTCSPREVPTTSKQWTQLVKAAHADWVLGAALVLERRGRVWIGGEVVHTRLSRGKHDQQVIHRFPQRGAQWRRSVIATLHPEGQMGPCWCGSGLPYCACHLAGSGQLADPCPCGSTKTLKDCHYIRPDAPEALAYYRRHLRDYETLRPELAASYRRARPEDNWPPEQILRLRGSGVR